MTIRLDRPGRCGIFVNVDPPYIPRVANGRCLQFRGGQADIQKADIRETVELALWRELAGSRYAQAPESIARLAESIVLAIEPLTAAEVESLAAERVRRADQALEVARSDAHEATSTALTARHEALADVERVLSSDMTVKAMNIALPALEKLRRGVTGFPQNP